MTMPALYDAPPAVDLELEREAIGVLLMSEAFVDALTDGLRREDFFREAHRQIWDAAVDLEQRGVRAEFVTVAEELRRRGQYDDPVYFAKLTDYRARRDERGRRYLVKRLRELSSARRLRVVLTTAAEDLATGRDLAERTAELIAQIEAERGDQGIDLRQYDPMGQAEVMIAELTRDPGEALTWGFPGIDEAIPGFYPGEVFGLFARPGIGKTLLLNHLARHVAPLGHVFFSLEMPAAQIAARLARSVYGYTRKELVAAAREGLDLTAYLQGAEGLLLVDAPGLSVAQIEGRLRALKSGAMRRTPIRLVTIDHLGLIGGDRRMSTYDRVSTQARELKELAKRHQVVVLVAVQVSREQGGDGSRELTLGCARDSGVVEEAMDYMLGLRRLDFARDASADTRLKFRDVILAKVLKNRHGALPPEEVAIRLNGSDLTLAEDPYLRADAADIPDLLARRGRR
jgi:replicative DNA helicase